MHRSYLGLAVIAMLVASPSALSAQNPSGVTVCQHTTDPAYSWTLAIGVDGKTDRFAFTPRNSAMRDANGQYAGDCTQDACTAEKPTTTGDTTYRTVLRIDRMAGIAQITQYKDNGDIWSKWQATCQMQDGSSDQ